MATFRLNELTLEDAKNHKQREYNPIEWERGIIRMTKWFGDVKFYEHGDDVYAIYEADDIRLITCMEYITSLNNGGLKTYYFNNGEIEEFPVKISKNQDDLMLAKNLTKASRGIVFASVYFNL